MAIPASVPDALLDDVGAIDAFVSYSRSDSTIAQTIVQSATAVGRNFWQDTSDILPAAEWRDELRRALESASSIVFLLSEAWLGSPECQRELQLAIDLGKRCVPVAIEPVPHDRVPDHLRALQWVDAVGRSDTEVTQRILRAIDTDSERVREHTLWLSRSLRWDSRSRDRSTLARGRELRTAEEWLAKGGADPSPTALQVEFVAQSRRQERRRQRRILTLVSLAAVIAIVLAGVATYQRGIAVRERNLAAAGRLIAESENGTADPAVADLESVAAWRLHPSADARYAMLEALTRPEIAVLRGHTSYVDAVAYSPDGELIASGGPDATVRLWDAQRHRASGAPIPSGTGTVRGLAFSPDGRLFAAVGENGTLRVWDVASRHLVSSVHARLGQLFALAWSPTGNSVVVGGENGAADVSVPHGIALWQLITVRQFVGVTAVVVDHDGQVMLGETFGSIAWLSLASGKQVAPPLNTRPPHVSGLEDFGVRALELSPDGKIFAEGGAADGQVRMYDARTHRQIGAALSSPEPVNALAFTPDGDILVTGSTDATVSYWDVTTHLAIGPPLIGHTSSVNALAMSPNGRTVVTGSADDTVRLWNTPLALETASTLLDPNGVRSLAYRPDGRIVAVAAGRFSGWGVHLLNPTTGKPVHALLPTTSPPSAVAYSRNGQVLAVADNASAVTLYDARTSRILRRILTPGRSMVSVAMSADGSLVASGTDVGTVPVWRTSTGKRIANFPPVHVNPTPVWSMAFAPRGTTVAYTGQVGDVVVYDLATRHLTLLRAHRTGVATAVAFEPSGNEVVTGGNDGTLKVWDVATGKQIGATLLAGGGGVQSLAVSPDGTMLASGYADGTVRLWDVATLQQLGPALPSGTEGAHALAFSPDGHSLATGNLDGSVRFWNLQAFEDPPRSVCQQAGRSMTRTEWTEDVGPGPAYQAVCPPH